MVLTGGAMKTCPFCAEEIKQEAIKCKHCHSMLTNEIAVSSPTSETTAIKVNDITPNDVLHHHGQPSDGEELPKTPAEGFSPSELQILNKKLSTNIRIGIFFSIFWLWGIGASIGLINGISALKIVKQTQGQLGGGFGAWFCILVGGGGVAYVGFVYLRAIFG